MDDHKKSASLKKGEIYGQKAQKEESPKKAQKYHPQKIQVGGKKNSIKLGICAVQKKVQSKPMRQILKRMKCEQIEIVEMWEFLDKCLKCWPVVDALICFYSDGFPYLKAWKYVKKYKPFLINSLEKQEYLWDRSVVYDILTKIHIPVAKHYYVFREMNYIDEIEAKAFVEDQEETQCKVDSPVGLHPSSSTIFEVPELEQRKSSKYSEAQDLRTSSIGKQSSSDNSKREINKKQTSQASNNNFNLQWYQDIRQPLSSLGKRRQLSNENRPSTLRKFLKQRQSKIDKYEVQEIDDYLLIKNSESTIKLKKPFVEKPFDAENHQIGVYYPESMGGGRKMLFRKVKNSSSKYEENENQIRKDGNYIYEEFLPTNAFDIKVYTIGSFYMYAEARKSPTLDGVVERNAEGKQKRFPIILTPQEKFMCKKIVQEFEQEVCGFDLLRANGKSYVCDVNGWSFVKSNPKYWHDCSIILKRKIFEKFFPSLMKEENRFYERFSIDSQNLYRPPSKNLPLKKEELRSIVSIFRHGDRSPKLKLKFKTSEPKFIEFFEDPNKNEIKMKDAKNLTRLLEVTNLMMAADTSDLKESDLTKLCQMRFVLESGGHFEGLNRKCQLKVIQRGENNQIQKILIVVKWGGELSAKGYNDSMELGKRMRMEKYKDQYDFLSLHSSYRHDLKTYSSDEGRCIKTAAAFLKGFLNIEGGLAPIITSMVTTNKKATYLLDCTSEQNHSLQNEKVKKKLSHLLNSDEQLLDSYTREVDIGEISSQMLKIIKQIGKPRERLKQIHQEIIELTLILQNYELSKLIQEPDSNRASNVSDEDEDLPEPRQLEDILFIYKRWSKLQKDFYQEDQMKFNISKIPEIYDTIRHDLSKNSFVFSNIDFDVEKFRQTSKLLAYFVVPNEYGMTDEQKIKTAQQIASPLLQKIVTDLMFWKDMNYEEQFWKYKNEYDVDYWKHIRTRLYFTSASHLYSVLHLITLGRNREILSASIPENAEKARKYIYMSYLSHIEFRLYENLQAEQNDPNRFRVELSISPDFSKNSPIEEASLGGAGFTIDQIQKFLLGVIKISKPSDLLEKLESSEPPNIIFES